MELLHEVLGREEVFAYPILVFAAGWIWRQANKQRDQQATMTNEAHDKVLESYRMIIEALTEEVKRLHEDKDA